MRTLATVLVFAFVVTGLWGPDSPVTAQDDCVSQGAVSPGQTALASDCEILLDIRNVLLGTATLDRSADIPADITIDDWEELRHTAEEAVLRNIAADPSLEARHFYDVPASLNWAAAVPIDDWDGITVDGTPRRVVDISLDYERLPGRIPKELGDLSGLQWLHLDGNELIGPVPNELGNLSSLTSLRLDVNKLRGSIPGEMGDLSKLTELHLDSNRLTGKIPRSFTNLTNLTDFRFSDNEGLCAPTDETFRAWLQAVDNVDGYACDFAADRATLVKLFDSTDGPNWLRSYGWLSDLPMGQWYGVYTDEEGRVTKLYLSENGLSGQIPAELGDLSNLYWLTLWENQLSGPVPPELGDLSRLEALNLHDNQLSGEIPSELGGISRLELLHLGGNQLSGQIPPEFGDLSQLNSLYLEDNLLSGQIPSELGGFSRLGFLDLGGNQLSGQIPPELGDLSRLNLLDLGENRLSGEIPEELGDLSRLGSLYLSENQLTGELPESLTGLPLRRLDFYNNPTLCAPVDEDFQFWLDGIDTVRGSSCAPADSQEDKALLALLYSGTDGENWDDNSNWLSSRPIREWYGVTNDAEGRVTGLYLWENRLRGSIPSEMGNLSQLQWLYLEQNELTGQVPRSFINLANLTSFYFTDNAGLCAPVDVEFQSWLQGIGEAEGASCNPVSDLNVLTRLYNATDGENWRVNSNWLSDLPMREWAGVETDDEGHVTVLDLHWNWLSGTLPQELGDLSNLEELDLADNQLSGTIPMELGSLPNLTKLYLSYNQLTGEIQPELGNLSDLTELGLWRNKLTGTIPTQLGNLSRLTSLSLSDNQLTGQIPPVLGDLSNLENLGLSDNQLTGQIPPVLGDLSNLDYLGLSDNQLTGEIPRSFTGLTRLTRFEFRNNAGLCAPTVEVFQAWLQDIDIVYGEACDFTPDRDVLVRLYKATDGDNWEDSSNWLTDRPMGDWYGVGTDNTGRITELTLSDNQLTGQIPTKVGSLTKLRWLSLGGNDLTGEIPPELGNLSSLDWLSLSNSHLTGEIPTQLANLAKLTWLWLGGNELTGEIPPVLGDLSNLRSLSLTDNQLSGTTPSQLGNLTNLTLLSLSDNQLTGELSDSLTGLTQLYTLTYHSNIGLCAPVNDSFQTWLQDIETVQGSSCAPVDSQADRAVLVKLYDATDGANWKDSSNWLSDRPVREWHGVTNDADGRVTGLYLWENQLRGRLPPELGSLSEMRWLDLWENQLTGSIPRELGSLTNLRSLNLRRNQLTGSIPRELGSLTSLRSLNLRRNQLTGSIPPDFGNLSNLNWLDLRDNQLTGSIPPEMGNLSNLIGIHLSNNQLTGCIPASLRVIFTFNDLDQLGLPICGIPTVTISVDSATYQVRIDSPVPVTATFSEPAYDFTASDITVANGDVGNFSGSDGDSVYTFDVIPNAIGVVTMDIAAGVTESYEGSSNLAAVQLTLGLPYDDDRDGRISLPEAIKSIQDYFAGLIPLEQTIRIVQLYFLSLG